MAKGKVSGKFNGNAKPDQAFDEYFSAVYGDRWPQLKSALRAPPRKMRLENPFGSGFSHYDLDEASLAPVRQLQLSPGQRIADFCASPGGKSLASIFALMGEAEWFCNDLSPQRVARLKAVFHDCIPPAILRRIRITCGDASRWGLRYKSEFERILLDAPCSGERHLLMGPETEIARWTVKGSQRLSVRQHALLCSALDCLRPAGRLVYSTCSISPLENDGVIDKLLRSREGRFRVVPAHEAMGEPTRHGWILMPDVCGCGPIYFSILETNPVAPMA